MSEHHQTDYAKSLLPSTQHFAPPRGDLLFLARTGCNISGVGVHDAEFGDAVHDLRGLRQDHLSYHAAGGGEFLQDDRRGLVVAVTSTAVAIADNTEIKVGFTSCSSFEKFSWLSIVSVAIDCLCCLLAESTTR